jgi:hypothetical protein
LVGASIICNKKDLSTSFFSCYSSSPTKEFEMITFQTAPRGTVTVTEANAHARRDQFAAIKPMKPSKIKGGTRRYPRFDVGMTTESYIRQFYFLNSIGGGYPFSKTLERAAPMLNPAEPEVEGS